MTRFPVTDLWERYRMALDDVTRRMERITRGLEAAHVAYALVGGQAVALWVATVDPAAVRTTKNVDILLNDSVTKQLPPEPAERFKQL